MSDGDEVRCAGRLLHRLASEAGKARLPTVVRLKDGTISIGYMSVSYECVNSEIIMPISSFQIGFKKRSLLSVEVAR